MTAPASLSFLRTLIECEPTYSAAVTDSTFVVVFLSGCAGMCADTYSYFLHRWLHVNKGAFVWLHAKHHEHKAALDTRSAGYMSVMEGIFSDALPMLFIYALGQLTGNWWMSFLGEYCTPTCWLCSAQSSCQPCTP